MTQAQEGRLPVAYSTTFDALLADVSRVAPPDVPLVPFWPLRGARYTGDLLVIGRSVNGWIEDWTAGELRATERRREAIERLRADAEPEGSDRMAWVLDLWGAVAGYNTRRSAFWRVLADLMSGLGETRWPSTLVWTNLYKASPAAGWNPGGDLQRAQRTHAAELLRIELETYRPRRVLAMTGVDWLSPFAEALRLEIRPRTGLIVGVAERSSTPWVLARHPMKKPQAQFVAEVRAAFAELGAPLEGAEVSARRST